MNKVLINFLLLTIGIFFYSGCSQEEGGKGTQLTCGQYADPNDPLGYKIRGDRCEGRIIKQTAAPIIEMVSATLGIPKVKNADSTSFRLNFYLNDSSKVNITLQELEPEEDYLMDNVSPQNGWVNGWNNYSWETFPVINELGIKITDLGVIATLTKPSSDDIWIVPVALYDSDLPFEFDNYYGFVYRLKQKVSWLNYSIFREGESTPIVNKSLHERFAGNVEIWWNASGEPKGIFKLVLNGPFSDESKIHKEVYFYHIPNIDKNQSM